jgi:hypothetical protein
MRKLNIKTHKMNNHYSGKFFFILSKGLNAGKPLDNPCPNCFVLFAENEEEKNVVYWICFGLWQAGMFRPFITGSVIPFIRLEDLRTVISNAWNKVKGSSIDFKSSIQVLRKLQECQENIEKQLHLVKQAKKSLMYKVLRA